VVDGFYYFSIHNKQNEAPQDYNFIYK